MNKKITVVLITTFSFLFFSINYAAPASNKELNELVTLRAKESVEKEINNIFSEMKIECQKLMPNFSAAALCDISYLKNQREIVIPNLILKLNQWEKRYEQCDQKEKKENFNGQLHSQKMKDLFAIKRVILEHCIQYLDFFLTRKGSYEFKNGQILFQNKNDLSLAVSLSQKFTELFQVEARLHEELDL